jgi:hypothetical protein
MGGVDARYLLLMQDPSLSTKRFMLLMKLLYSTRLDQRRHVYSSIVSR